MNKLKERMSRRSTVNKTLSLPITTFAMMEEICQKEGYQNYEECIVKVFSKHYQALGLGLP